MSKSFSLVSFLEDFGEFKNTHGVSFLLLQDYSIYLSSPFPGSPDGKAAILFIGQYSENVSNFEKLFNARSRFELEKIAPAYLFSLFLNGLAEVACTINDRYFGGELLFKMNAERSLVANNEGTGTTHRVEDPLLTYYDFVQYTATFYLINSHTLRTSM
jgi:hypothetical protein